MKEAAEDGAKFKENRRASEAMIAFPFTVLPSSAIDIAGTRAGSQSASPFAHKQAERHPMISRR